MNHLLGRAGAGINAAPEEGDGREEVPADRGEEFGLGQADKIWRQKAKIKKAAVKFRYFEVGIYTFQQTQPGRARSAAKRVSMVEAQGKAESDFLSPIQFAAQKSV